MADKKEEFYTTDDRKCLFCGEQLHDVMLEQQGILVQLLYKGTSYKAHNRCFEVWQVGQKLLE